MNDRQEEHLAWLVTEVAKRLDGKFRSGDAEHGGPGIRDLPHSVLLDHAIEEALDQLAYLLTLRRQTDLASTLYPYGTKRPPSKRA